MLYIGKVENFVHSIKVTQVKAHRTKQIYKWYFPLRISFVLRSVPNAKQISSHFKFVIFYWRKQSQFQIRKKNSPKTWRAKKWKIIRSDIIIIKISIQRALSALLCLQLGFQIHLRKWNATLNVQRSHAVILFCFLSFCLFGFVSSHSFPVAVDERTRVVSTKEAITFANWTMHLGGQLLQKMRIEIPTIRKNYLSLLSLISPLVGQMHTNAMWNLIHISFGYRVTPSHCCESEQVDFYSSFA